MPWILDGDDDDDKKKKKTVKVADVEFDFEKTFNRLFEKDIPKPGKRAPKRNYPKSHYSGISPEQRAKNIQARVDAGSNLD